MIEEYYSIQPGASLSKTTLSAGGSKVSSFDYILCDGAIARLAAKGDTLTAGVADISAASGGVYAASDAACLTINTPRIEGKFSEVYNHSAGNVIRVHVAQPKM
jgi:hypothetical protein